MLNVCLGLGYTFVNLETRTIKSVQYGLETTSYAGPKRSCSTGDYCSENYKINKPVLFIQDKSAINRFRFIIVFLANTLSVAGVYQKIK